MSMPQPPTRRGTRTPTMPAPPVQQPPPPSGFVPEITPQAPPQSSPPIPWEDRVGMVIHLLALAVGGLLVKKGFTTDDVNYYLDTTIDALERAKQSRA